MQLSTKGSETSAVVTEEDDDDEEAAPPVIAPRPDHTKSVRRRLSNWTAGVWACVLLKNSSLYLTAGD